MVYYEARSVLSLQLSTRFVSPDGFYYSTEAANENSVSSCRAGEATAPACMARHVMAREDGGGGRCQQCRALPCTSLA
eukprot:4310880-Pleurochrysis_carterae.AAC.1